MELKGHVMAEVRPSREEALTLLKTYNQNEGLIKHALAVEAVMRYCARKRGQDEQMWGVIGLVHDLDYEQFPEQHCRKTEEILISRNWPVSEPDWPNRMAHSPTTFGSSSGSSIVTFSVPPTVPSRL